MKLECGAGSFIVSELMLRQPAEGVWRGRIKVASPDIVEGEQLTLADDEGNAWIGVARGVVASGPQAVIDIVGGAGQLDSLTLERYYAGGGAYSTILSDLCADVGESPDTAIAGQVGTWRTRGDSLRGELGRLSRFTTGAYRIDPAGLVSLSVASGDTDSPGRFLREDHGSRTYETSGLKPFAGLTVDGWEVGVALWTRSGEKPLSVSLWRSEPRRTVGPPAVVEGRISASNSGRVDVITSTGVALTDVPLFSVAGYLPEVETDGRVLILDLGGDPRATIAIAGAADAAATELTIGDGADVTIGEGGKSVSIGPDALAVDIGKGSLAVDIGDIKTLALTLAGGIGLPLQGAAAVGHVVRYGDIITFSAPGPAPIMPDPSNPLVSRVIA